MKSDDEALGEGEGEVEEPETVQAEEVQGLLDVLEPLRRPHRDMVGEYIFFDEPPLGVSSPMENCPDCKAKDKKIADLEISIKCGGTDEAEKVTEREAWWLIALFTRAEAQAHAAIQCLKVKDLTGAERYGKDALEALTEAVQTTCRKQDGREIL